MSDSAVINLPADYYLVNFRQLIGFVGSTYAPVLSAAELAFHSNFEALPENAQRLYVRLLCRTGSFFRASKLTYPEITDLNEAIVSLEHFGFLAIDTNLNLETLLPLYTRAELVRLLNLTHLKNVKRAEIENHVRIECCAAAVVESLMDGEMCLEVLHAELFLVYRLCFFGNLYQDMTDFVLRDLGLTQFENYVIDSNTIAFQTRDQIVAHLQYYHCAERFDAAMAESTEALLELHSQLPPVTSNDTNLKRRIDRLTNAIARQLEREQNYDSAIKLYRQTDRPPARERQARVLQKLGRSDESIDICRQILIDPRNEDEFVFAEQFGARIAKKSGTHWVSQQRYTPPEEKLVLLQTGPSVESVAADYYNEQGLCFYTENALFNGVFGLAFWDIVFAPVSGVFFNPFQSAPADFYEPQFRQARADSLASRFEQFTSIDVLAGTVMSFYDEKQGIQNPLVQWRYLGTDLLQKALDRVPLYDWLVIFRRLLGDLRYHRTGFTDLILFPTAGGYVLIEVKGPGDSLQKNQLRWMQFFALHDIKHQITHVSWSRPGQSAP